MSIRLPFFIIKSCTQIQRCGFSVVFSFLYSDSLLPLFPHFFFYLRVVKFTVKIFALKLKLITSDRHFSYSTVSIPLSKKGMLSISWFSTYQVLS